MPKCMPYCGVGVRHCQYLFCALLLTFEYWTDEIMKSALFSPNIQSQLKAHKMTATIFIDVSTGSFTLGRLCSSLLVLRVKNKYLLLFTCSLEFALASVCYWEARNYKYHFALAIFALVSFLRAFHTVFLANLVAKWTPPVEYATAMAIIFVTRSQFGLLFTVYFARSQGTAMMANFYTILPTYLLMCILFIVVITDGPETSFLLSKVEYDYLARTIGPRKKTKCSVKIPWKNIFATPVLYGWFLADLGKECCQSVLVETHALLARFPSTSTIVWVQLTAAVFSFLILCTFVYMDRLVNQEVLTNGQVSKIFSAIGTCGMSLTLILSAYIGENHTKVFSIIVFGNCFSAITTIALPITLFATSPNYTAVLVGIDGFFKVILATAILKLNVFLGLQPLKIGSFETVFYEMGFLVFMANLIFLLSGPVELRSFDSYETVDWRKQSNLSYP